MLRVQYCRCQATIIKGTEIISRNGCCIKFLRLSKEGGAASVSTMGGRANYFTFYDPSMTGYAVKRAGMPSLSGPQGRHASAGFEFPCRYYEWGSIASWIEARGRGHDKVKQGLRYIKAIPFCMGKHVLSAIIIGKCSPGWDTN